MRRTVLFLLCCALLSGCAGRKPVSETDAARSGYECHDVDYFDYSLPAGENKAVDSYWFADALFIGDVRVRSLYHYSNLLEEGADVHYINDLALDNLETEPAETDEDASMADLLMASDKKNIFVMTGINDIAEGDLISWKKRTKDLLAKFRSTHRDSKVFLMMPYHIEILDGVSGEALKERMDAFRTIMLELGREEQYYCIDCAEAVEDPVNGLARDEYIWDGISLNEDGTRALMEYIARHVVKENEYVRSVCS